MNVKRGLSVVMAVPQTTPSPSPHLYPQELQLKLYQAFIFSIPILFSIILVLLFYLFYLKRRASSLSSPPLHILPTTANPQSAYPYPSSPYRLDLTLQFLDKLPRILFDEDLRARDSVCCVCLGEFEVKEEVIQIPYCKHVFHIECIHNWLQSNSTCPLCRCSIIPTTKIISAAAAAAAPVIASSDPPLTQQQQDGEGEGGGGGITSYSGSPSHPQVIVSLPSPQPQLGDDHDHDHDEPSASSDTPIFQGCDVLTA